jgi:hypothetical protein
MRKKSVLIIALLSLCFLLFIGLCTYLADKGCRSSTAAAMAMRQVEKNWQSGQMSKALSEFPAALRVSLECGVRCQIAQPYVDRMSALEAVGHLEEALAECERASQILDDCDAEGSFDYLCNVLQMRLMLSSTPTPDVEH